MGVKFECATGLQLPLLLLLLFTITAIIQKVDRRGGGAQLGPSRVRRDASIEPTPGIWFEWEVRYFEVGWVNFVLPGPLIGRLTADGDSTQRTQVDSGEIPPSAAGRRRWPAPRVGGAVHRRGREWSAARFYFGEAPHRD